MKKLSRINSTDRNIALDLLKLIMAFMVVGLHAGFMIDVTKTGFYLLVNGIFRIAVPVFLLINGFFFYQVLKHGRTIQWFKRVAILYIFWMLFYAYFWLPPLNFSLETIFIILRKVFRNRSPRPY